MKVLVAFALFAVLHLAGWGAAHVWLSANKKQTLVVVDTSFAMKPHFGQMQKWLKDFEDNSRYTEIVVGTDKTLMGPLQDVRSMDSIFRSAFGDLSSDSLNKYSNEKSSRKILLSDGSVELGGWETVVFQ